MTSNARELAQIPSTPSGRRNIVINGAMQVKQYGSPHTVANANRAFAADRFQFVNVTGSNQTVTNSTTSPSGFSNSLKIDVDTAVSGGDSGAYAYLGQKIEGQNLQHFDYGASGAKTITLSFYVRSPKTGTHVVELNAPDGSRNISGTYTVASANTWEEHSITFAGDASGTINNDTGIGLEIFFWLVAGSDLSGGGSLNTSWTTNPTTNTRAVGQVNVFDNTSNVFYLTGVQLEVGSVATEFEHRSFGEELQLCKRYYNRTTRSGNDNVYFGVAQVASSTQAYAIEKWEVAMRANPTFGISAATDAELFGAMGAKQSSAVSLLVDGTQNGLISITVASGLTQDNAVRAYLRSADAFYELDAEL